MAGAPRAGIYIAGRLTGHDWLAFRKQVQVGGPEEPWAQAFADYFETRLKLRYLLPIDTLISEGTLRGEGFSIVALQCTLIEFLAAVKDGKNYRRLTKAEHKAGVKIGPNEYDNSREIFTKFLSGDPVFAPAFPTIDEAEEFYVSVRCGLLHEAQTKNGWTIWAGTDQGPIVDAKRKIVFRDKLQKAILGWVQGYGLSLVKDKTLQDGFLRKFDNLNS